MPKVSEDDFNLIDQMNGVAGVSAKGFPPDIKGAGSTWITGVEEDFNNLIHNRNLFMYQKKNELVSNIAEFWNYEGLPVDKYRFEEKLLDNGQLAMYKIGGVLAFSPFTIIDYDIYGAPLEIEIVEAKDSFLNGFRPSKFAIIRSEISCQSIWTRIMRYLIYMEKILYALEDNITASKPKGLLITNGMKITTPTNKDMQEAMESIVNSQNTFFEVNAGDIMNSDNFNTDMKTMWVPLELSDRTETLIANYNFMQEKLKEEFGLGMNTLQKKERLITDEMTQQQKVSNANITHLYNIRKLDIENANQMLGTSVEIIQNEELWEVGEPEGKGSDIDEMTKN